MYDLGIDVGTSFTAAAVSRWPGGVEVAGLGPIADNIPTIVYAGEDGLILVGDAASRRAAFDPTGAARSFKRRMGDPTPIILRSSPFSVETLVARVVEYVVRRVSDREGGQPRCVVLTHPANWGPYKRELFEQAMRIANIERGFILPEPAAAAKAYTAETRVADGAITAVYDLGGGTFDAAVLRKSADTFDLLGESTGIEHLGGDDFDEAIFQYVKSFIGADWPTLSDDPMVVVAMHALRRSCTEAKELLSSEPEAHIPVVFSSVDTTVKVTRSQFEAMIESRIADSVRSLEAAVNSAGIDLEDLQSVVLVGGSSRIPLVAEMVRNRFGSIVAVDIDPLYAVARGAALEAGRRGAGLETRPMPRVGGSPEQGADAARYLGAAHTIGDAQGEPDKANQHAPIQSGERVASSAIGKRPHVDRELVSSPLVETGSPFAARLRPASSERRPAEPAGTPPVPRHVTSDDGHETRPVYERLPSLRRILLPALVLLIFAGLVAALFARGWDGRPAAHLPPSKTPSAQGMTVISGGTYWVGTNHPNTQDHVESSRQKQQLNLYYIDTHEVTNENYSQFVDAYPSAQPPMQWQPGSSFPTDKKDFPVEGVSYDWAVAFCASLGKRLPTEAEWEVAARGSTDQMYPWGNNEPTGRLAGGGPYAVGSQQENKSPFGVYDLAGNVWEWVADSYDPAVGSATKRVLRGGQNGYARPTWTRLLIAPAEDSMAIFAGFRCAATTAEPSVQPWQFGPFSAPSIAKPTVRAALPPDYLFCDDFHDPTSGWAEYEDPTREKAITRSIIWAPTVRISSFLPSRHSNSCQTRASKCLRPWKPSRI